MSSGIYKILNTITLKFYIGSTTNFTERWKQHINQAKAGNHHSIHFQRAWDKYGESAFSFQEIEHVIETDLIAREQYWLDHLEPWKNYIGYNCSPTAGSNLGLVWSIEQKLAHSVRNSGSLNGMYGKKGKANPNFGSKRNDETRARMSKAQSGENNPMFGKLGKDSPNAKKIHQKTKLGDSVKIWECLSDIASNLNISAGNVSSCCTGRIKSYKGFKWEYAN